jgi:hypothetical protein
VIRNPHAELRLRVTDLLEIVGGIMFPGFTDGQPNPRLRWLVVREPDIPGRKPDAMQSEACNAR